MGRRAIGTCGRRPPGGPGQTPRFLEPSLGGARPKGIPRRDMAPRLRGPQAFLCVCGARLGRRRFHVGVQLSGRRWPHDEGSRARHCLMQPHGRGDDDLHHRPRPSRLPSAESAHGSKGKRRRGLLSLYNKPPIRGDSSCVHTGAGSAQRIWTPARAWGEIERAERERPGVSP